VAPPAPVRPPGGGVPLLRGPAGGPRADRRAAVHDEPLPLPAPSAAEASDASEALAHPALWRAHQLARAGALAWRTGFDALDAELPGGGWPAQALTELLLPQPGIGELRLLAPLLALATAPAPAACLEGGAEPVPGHGVMLFDPPALPCPWALAALGVDACAFTVVRPRQPVPGPARERLPPAADILWALEHALKSGHLGVVLAWLPANVRPEALRRLQLAAQAHPGPAFLLRDTAAALRPGPLPLRLALSPAGAEWPDRLRVRILKRRGPPVASPLVLALPPVLDPQRFTEPLPVTVSSHATAPVTDARHKT
jgi:protein ImuA